MKNLFLFIFKAYIVFIGVLFIFNCVKDYKGSSVSEYEQFLADEEKEQELEAEYQLKQDYGDYCFDMERINWEGHCRDVLFSLGPPPPEYTSGRALAFMLCGKEAGRVPNINPIVKIKTFEEFKNQ